MFYNATQLEERYQMSMICVRVPKDANRSFVKFNYWIQPWSIGILQLSEEFPADPNRVHRYQTGLLKCLFPLKKRFHGYCSLVHQKESSWDGKIISCLSYGSYSSLLHNLWTSARFEVTSHCIIHYLLSFFFALYNYISKLLAYTLSP